MKFQAGQISQPNQSGNRIEYYVMNALQLFCAHEGRNRLRGILLVKKLVIRYTVRIADRGKITIPRILQEVWGQLN
ncbi:hypothetical protein D3C73_1247550 [compost metagenome]